MPEKGCMTCNAKHAARATRTHAGAAIVDAQVRQQRSSLARRLQRISAARTRA